MSKMSKTKDVQQLLFDIFCISEYPSVIGNELYPWVAWLFSEGDSRPLQHRTEHQAQLNCKDTAK